MISAILSAVLASPTPVAVMIHGAGGGGWEYRLWQPVFEKAGYRVVAKNLYPGPEGIANTQLDDYTFQIIRWVNGGRADVVVGASMGGILALLSADALGAKAIILVNSVPPAEIGKEWRDSKSQIQWPDVIEWSKGTLKETRDSMPESSEDMIQYAFKHWRDESGAVMSQLARGVQVPKPKTPVLVMIGGKDTDIPRKVSEELAWAYRADIRRYSDLSHVGPLLGTNAPKVAQDAVSWLASKKIGRTQPR
ncbi:MAG: alpha/beta fold hydrolase [Armatimonadetes bacterium]|nr:alpha/beta fold hydrolase [Armatimonadota bacterium]